MGERYAGEDPVSIRHEDEVEVVRVGDRLVIGKGGGVRVRVYPGGPVLVSGAAEVLERDGNRVACARATVALCRCNKSRLRIFCDGTHRFVTTNGR
jgi:hypothetical protein